MGEGQRARHGLVLLLLAHEAAVQQVRAQALGDVHAAAAGEHEFDVAAGALAEDMGVLHQQRRALQRFAPAGVEQVGRGQAARAGEGGGVDGKRVQPHAHHLAVGELAPIQPPRQQALGLAVEQQPAHAGEHLGDDVLVGEALVVQAGHQPGALGGDLADRPGEPKQVGAGEDGVERGRLAAQRLNQRGTVDAVLHPAELVGGRDRLAARDVGLQAQEERHVAGFVHREEAHAQATHPLLAGRDLVFPGVVVAGAGGEKFHRVPGPGAVVGQTPQQGLGPAHHAALGEAGRDKGQLHGAGRPASSRARRASRSARRFSKLLTELSMAVTISPLAWFCCAQRR